MHFLSLDPQWTKGFCPNGIKKYMTQSKLVLVHVESEVNYGYFLSKFISLRSVCLD